ncbi:MAG: DUF2520 domain-containing protein [Sphingobacteriales bacterium]|nr:DUF2520 domain-containing protein [Sphingobacteriales bacterium]
MEQTKLQFLMHYFAVMNVVIIGTGNVAAVISTMIKATQHKLLQVAGRNILKAEALASSAGAEASSLDSVRTDADLYIIAVADTALPEIAQKLHVAGVVAHTAGAVTKDILANASAEYGVLYPLQSLKANLNDLPPVPFLIDGNNNKAITKITAFAGSVSHQVAIADDGKRLKLHTAAVFVNNFTNYLFAVTSDFCKKEGVDFSLLFPLMEETVRRLRTHDPADVQTGPAIRNDLLTISRHLQVLANYPLMSELYSLFTERIRGYWDRSKG